jgi:hypothetical protein
MEASTLRALASDLGYREAWCQAATGSLLPWPAAEDLALTFVAHHLWAPVQREADPNSGMQQNVADGLRALEWLRVDGPHTPKTVCRRLAHWSMLHRGPAFRAPSKPLACGQGAGLRRPPSRRKRVPDRCWSPLPCRPTRGLPTRSTPRRYQRWATA